MHYKQFFQYSIWVPFLILSFLHGVMKFFCLLMFTVFSYSALAAIDVRTQVTGVVKSYDQNTVTLYQDYKGGIRKVNKIPRSSFPSNIKLKTGKRVSIVIDKK